LSISTATDCSRTLRDSGRSGAEPALGAAQRALKTEQEKATRLSGFFYDWDEHMKLLWLA